MSEYNYELKHPFSYASKGGENQDAAFITLTAPTFKQMCKVAPIKQAFMAAICEINESEESDSDKETSDDSGDLSSEQAIQLMYRGSGDMVKILLHAEQLFKSGVALVDGEVKLTTPLMEKMQPVDFEGLLGDYIANFIAPSLMDGQSKDID